MKKIIAVMIALSFFAGLATAVFAKDVKKAKTAATAENKTEEKKVELAVIKGPIVSLNIPQNQIVIKDSVTTYDRVFVVDPDVYKSIKLGDEVEAKFVSGGEKIESIKVTKAAPVQKEAPTETTSTTTKETKSTKKSKK